MAAADARGAMIKAHVRRRRREGQARLPRGAGATPSEDSALFNPLVHGNRRFGRKFRGRPFTTARKYKGPSGKR